MNKHTSSYPEFLSAVSGGRVCFVFGAGASKSLSSEAVGWLDWLQSGVSMLEGHGELKLVMKGESVGDAGANELIELAGEVIAAAKEEGVYEKWMTEYVANPKVENLELSRVLRKIPAVHDFIATTNYDLLLEQATGLGTTSWSNPGEAFQMISALASLKLVKALRTTLRRRPDPHRCKPLSPSCEPRFCPAASSRGDLSSCSDGNLANLGLVAICWFPSPQVARLRAPRRSSLQGESPVIAISELTHRPFAKPPIFAAMGIDSTE